MPASEIIASLAIGIAIMELFRWRGYKRGLYAPSFCCWVGEYRWSNDRLAAAHHHRRWLRMMCSLWLFTHYTKMGLSLRAIAQDKHASMMSGIEPDRTAVIS